ncbi:MAG TPA: superoxide dismutase family protein [Spongiibacteraceae bacterium]|nr:superoxide dismutase family protein [Spongiibacteraceae bacterium]
MRKTLMASCVVLAMAGCAALQHEPSAQAKLAPTQGNTANGTVTFTQHGDKVLLDAEIAGLTPGLHGFHIHEKGDCSAPDGTSAGGHFNPTHQPHGEPSGIAHHVGDLPMLYADADGRAKLHVELDSVALQGEQSIVGRAVIIHQKPDDFVTQPTGNSGARVACGVIMAVK